MAKSLIAIIIAVSLSGCVMTDSTSSVTITIDGSPIGAQCTK